jgi:3-oxoacid CoA-transferase subunit B
MTGERIPLDLLALRVANELRDGEVVNLGYGIPGLVASYLLDRPAVWLQSENGILGLGPVLDPDEPSDPELVNAMGQPSITRAGASYFDSALSFAMIRGGHVDTTVLGGLQVSRTGDLANWMVPERRYGGVGGAMDLCIGANRVIVAMQHTTLDGVPKIVEECTYPLTGRACVKTIVTDIAVIDVEPDGLHLREVAPGWSPEEVQMFTAVPLVYTGQVPDMAL